MNIQTLPQVLYCNVTQCAYNHHEKCHAAAITVDSPSPLCDTFFKSNHKGGYGEDNSRGCVGACKNSLCIHNHSYECTASGIGISFHNDQAECNTFRTAQDV